MCVVLSGLFFAALWSSTGKELTSWLSCVLRFLVFVSMSISDFRARWRHETGLSPQVKYFTDRYKACCFCVSFVIYVLLWRLFIAVLWSPAGKGLTSWLLFVMFNYVLSLSHVVSWVRCGA